MSNEITDIKDILRLIDEENVKLESNVFVPSLDKEVHVKALNSNHSKNILKSSVDGPFMDNQFNMVAYAILNDIWDRSVPLTKINIYDKLLILLQLRTNNISKEIEVDFVTNEGKKNEKRTKQKVNIPEHIKPFLVSTVFDDVVIDDVKDGEPSPEGPRFTATLAFPSVVEEFAFDNSLHKNRLVNINEEDKHALKALFAPMFTNNIAQYITSFGVGDKVFNLSSRKVDERLAVVEKLPAIIQDKAMQKIEEYFTPLLKKITSVEVTLKDVTYKGEIDIDASLFVGSN